VRLRRGGRAVDCAGLENRKAERSREFESHPLRDFLGTCVSRVKKHNIRHNKPSKLVLARRVQTGPQASSSPSVVSRVLISGTRASIGGEAEQNFEDIQRLTIDGADMAA
jgi:hypothetical protein